MKELYFCQLTEQPPAGLAPQVLGADQPSQRDHASTALGSCLCHHCVSCACMCRGQGSCLCHHCVSCACMCCGQTIYLFSDLLDHIYYRANKLLVELIAM